MNVYQKPLRYRPTDLPSGAPMFLMPANAAAKHDERCVTYAWLGNRRLFGEVYRGLLPAYSRNVPIDSGVMIGTFVQIDKVLPSLRFPGDIDVLVIPYEGDQLVLSHTLAIEIKVMRASFLRQQKSPNQFGFSQAKGLLAAGFPYVAVGHLIVSDQSPKEAWREMAETRILDADSGRCAPLERVRHDMLPADLMRRSHGRLMRNCPDPLLGHFSAYPVARGTWFPETKEASHNPLVNSELLDGIYEYYEQNHQSFLWTRSHPSASPCSRKDWESEKYLKQLVGKMQQDFH